MQRCGSRVRLIAALVALVLLSGCAATPMTTQLTASPPQGLPVFTELSETPFFAQTAYYCGPAALATVLNTTGLELTPEILAKSVYTPGRQGTLQTEIITGTRRQGRLALPVRNMSEAFLNVANSRPVLILQNLALEIAPQWHYAVLVGYDMSGETVTLRSGTTRRYVLSMETFEHTWRRSDFWGIVVARPEGPVPDHTTLSEWMQEAYALQRVENKAAALTAFTVASRHWPDAPAPLVATANILVESGRLQEAAIKLQAAVQRQPNNPVALNNLAHVLMLLGALEQAETIALKAVKNGGSFLETAKQTLTMIQAQKK